MRITALAGGVGAARFLRGLLAAVPDADITVIGNTGDDFTPFGLHVCPDLDTVMYTLGGGISEEQGWGRAGETHAVLAELAAYGAGPGWFGLGDLTSPPTSCATRCSAEGRTLSEVTQQAVRALAAGCRRCCRCPTTRCAPMSPSSWTAEQELHFQEWWVRLHAAVPARRIEPVGAPARPDRRRRARRPSPTLTSSAPALEPGRQHRDRSWQCPASRKPSGADVVGVSPIIGGRPGARHG